MSNPTNERPRPRPSARPRPAPARAAAPVGSMADAITERLPVNELLFDRAGAGSPFGDDLVFPLPSGALAYRHPQA